ncbi:hypothetical protein [Flindersiella endophytica]
MIAPIAWFSEQVANSPAFKAATAAGEIVQWTKPPQVLHEFTKQQAALSNSPAMKAMAELAHRTSSPAIQQLAKQYTEVAEVSRLVRAVSEAIATPERQLVKEQGDSE